MGKSPGSKSKAKESKPQLRIVCVSSLAGDQEVVLASRDEKGGLLELGTAVIRSSTVSDWLPAAQGELHLALREEKALKSICNFQYPEGTRHALVVLTMNAEKNAYEANVVDPEKSGFVKGSVLIFNFSQHAGLVSLGSKEEEVGAGLQLAAKPVLEDNAMCRMMVSYRDADGKTQSRYDRYVSLNPNARSMLFLLPEKTQGIKVSSLPIFGDFE